MQKTTMNVDLEERVIFGAHMYQHNLMNMFKVISAGRAVSTAQGPPPEGAPLCIAHGGMVPREIEIIRSFYCSKNSNSEITSPFSGVQVMRIIRKEKHY